MRTAHILRMKFRFYAGDTPILIFYKDIFFFIKVYALYQSLVFEKLKFRNKLISFTKDSVSVELSRINKSCGMLRRLKLRNNSLKLI